MRIIRSVLSIILGYAAVLAVILPGFSVVEKSHPQLLTTVRGPVILFAISCVAGVVGGFVAATVAGRRRFLHASVLGILMMIAGLLMIKSECGKDYAGQPMWYIWGLPFAALITSMIGGALRGGR